VGRNMFSGGQGPWEDDPKGRGWWGDNPPFHHPVFVLTSQAREPLEMEGGTTFHFVTDGIESALEQARAAAGDQDVSLAGGAQAISQYLKAGLVDEMQLHVVPIFLGDGARLFDDHVAQAPGRLELTRVVESPTGAVHLRYQLGGH
jgi:dihydrofolate reductase